MADKIVHNHTPKSELEDPGLFEGIKEKIGDKIEDHKEKKEEKQVEEHKAALKSEEVVVHPPEPSCEPEEKKGIIEKIKDKLPGGHKDEEKTDGVPDR